MKVGRSTGCTSGNLWNHWKHFTPEGLHKKCLIITVNDKDNIFSKKGDSGSPVFEDNGILWGIMEGLHHHQSKKL
ncbi:hypothetical protein C1646_778367 [Rhizophagus diaphanus]|nr:hypothetical protein C1646_778367 [Rhizophagus diaphanus] [Rhizophagus sp. MUCL 43196]